MALAALAGGGSAVQARVNGELGTRLGDGIAAAAVSFGVGLILVAALTAATPIGRAGVGRLREAMSSGRLRWWQGLGGLCGAFFVVSQGIAAGALGVAVFTVASVAGQSVGGLAVDRLGLGPTGRHELTWPRIAGAALSVVAVAVAAGGLTLAGTSALLALMPAVAGFLIGWQTAMNGLVRQATGSVLTTTLLNFATGTVGLALALAVDVALRGPFGPLPAEPWLYTGGVLGVLFIAVAATVVRLTGVLLLGLASIAGQITGSVVVDYVAPGGAGAPDLSTLVGAALALVAVAVATARPTGLGNRSEGISPVR
ncbi:DMT family transporter [Pilimelia columellifera subsp. columellifera]|uniref:DMT family transporter n=1 Tax=Pilimelia columellifera subsp. columellifera TaxID=706583 RepID=A0ABN3N5R1_9ACTN